MSWEILMVVLVIALVVTLVAVVVQTNIDAPAAVEYVDPADRQTVPDHAVFEPIEQRETNPQVIEPAAVFVSAAAVEQVVHDQSQVIAIAPEDAELAPIPLPDDVAQSAVEDDVPTPVIAAAAIDSADDAVMRDSEIAEGDEVGIEPITEPSPIAESVLIAGPAPNAEPAETFEQVIQTDPTAIEQTDEIEAHIAETEPGSEALIASDSEFAETEIETVPDSVNAAADSDHEVDAPDSEHVAEKAAFAPVFTTQTETAELFAPPETWQGRDAEEGSEPSTESDSASSDHESNSNGE